MRNRPESLQGRHKDFAITQTCDAGPGAGIGDCAILARRDGTWVTPTHQPCSTLCSPPRNACRPSLNPRNFGPISPAWLVISITNRWRSVERKTISKFCVGFRLTCPSPRLSRSLKSNSSRWLRENGGWLGWQEGYGAFSVSASNVDAVRRYIQNQPEHHRRRSFEDEFVALLAKSGRRVQPRRDFHLRCRP